MNSAKISQDDTVSVITALIVGTTLANHYSLTPPPPIQVNTYIVN